MNIKLEDMIVESDMVLVGIGYEFTVSLVESKYFCDMKRVISENSELEWILPFIKAYLEQKSDCNVIASYNKLSRMLEGKNYFIVSVNQDSLIEESELDQSRIVRPCGTSSLLQCNQDCDKKLWKSNEILEFVHQESIKKTGHLEEIERPLCPLCKAPMVLNNVHADQYNEEGYLAQWNLYTNWIQATLNKKICILELGVGMEYPSIIRWPFEKIAYFNQKAKFIRVHKRLFQLSEELKEKGTFISENACDFLLGQFLK